MPVLPLFSESVTCFETLLERLELGFAAGVRGDRVGVVLAAGTLDPLQVLDQALQPESNFGAESHFFFEREGRSLLGLGCLCEREFVGGNRFAAARAWMRSIQVRGLDPSWVRFCCGFAFFEAAGGAVMLPQWVILREEGRSQIIVCWEIGTETPEEVARIIWQQVEIWQSMEEDWQTERSQIHSPQIHSPQIHSPQIHSPQIHSPQIHSPQIHSPQIHSPLGIENLSPNLLQGHRFMTGVCGALDAIAAGEVEKVVLAECFEQPGTVDLIASIDQMRDRYSGCYVFSEGNGQGNLFFGASPERLARFQDGILVTEALAGTVRRGADAAEDEWLGSQLLKSNKDTHEHQLVIDFITQQLMSLGLEAEARSPMLLKLHNIQHLHTPIVGKVPRGVHVLEVVEVLHPTPAVAGVPRSVACGLIRSLEGFDRGRYAGPIGWVDALGNGEFAVGIRSAQVTDGQICLFAGAGIVAGSVPAKEWAEVLLKLESLRGVIGYRERPAIEIAPTQTRPASAG